MTTRQQVEKLASAYEMLDYAEGTVARCKVLYEVASIEYELAERQLVERQRDVEVLELVCGVEPTVRPSC